MLSKLIKYLIIIFVFSYILFVLSVFFSFISFPDTTAGWKKYEGNPVLGGDLGTVFDVSVIKEENKEENIYRMWFSWRPKQGIGLTESQDGIHWSEPKIVLSPNPHSDWEININRPIVIKKEDGYHMWYTGQTANYSAIGYAISSDGINWKKVQNNPVLFPEQEWEKNSVMCPHVLYDNQTTIYQMWYSGGDYYEPNAIGYAISEDGIHWIKNENNPIFTPDTSSYWEKDRVTGCQVIKYVEWYFMFYIGFKNINSAQIGLARSKNGISDWERHPENPIIQPSLLKWDSDSVYKPFALYEDTKWLLYYNGRRGSVEQIGLAIHEGSNLWI